MDASYWHQKWENNQLGFHESEVNPLLVNYFKRLSLAQGSRVFVPLCGKTLDIAWLLSNGMRVVGAELSEMAIAQLFAELGVQPSIKVVGDLKRYSAKDIDILVCDFFTLSDKTLGLVDAAYDRAALVALPKEMRHRYTAHLMEITHHVPQLLVTLAYDQSVMEGPPFSVSDAEVNQHYRGAYHLTRLESTSVPDGLKGKCEALENVWLLKTD